MTIDDILRNTVQRRFGITVSLENLSFINLNQDKHKSLHPKNYPTFTLLWQCFAYIKVCIHAYNLMPCDIFVDTMGVGFAYPFVKLLFGCKIYSYTHYPIVSNDMLKTVSDGTE